MGIESDTGEQADIEALQKPLMVAKDVLHDPNQSWKRYLRAGLTPALFTTTSGTPKTRGPTAFLDGLRGWAAFDVYISHHMLGSHMHLGLELGYGHDDKYYLVAFPFLRPFFSGSHQAVHIFFICSGYCLSRSVLTMIHNGASGDKIISSLASAASRRFVRLWTPVFVTTFLTMTIMYIIGHRGAEAAPSYLAEIAHYLNNLNTLIVPLSKINWLMYNPHTWTIPYEVRGSIYVFLALLATHKMKKHIRLMLIATLAIWVHWNGSWGCSTFLSGVILAEVDLIRDDEWPQWQWLKFLTKHKTKIYVILLIFALHTAGQPMKPFGALPALQYYHTYGYGWMGLQIPMSYAAALNDFWYTFGALIMVLAAKHIDLLRTVFELRASQYLGQISFGFYLVHGPVMFILGERLYAATGVFPMPNHQTWNNIWEFGKFGPEGMEFNFLCCHLILLPITLYLAEVCTRMVDEPSVRLSHYLYRKSLA